MTITKTLLRSYWFFLANAGYVVGHHAECALSLARAEQHASENDWAAEWVADDCPDLSWMSDEERHREHHVLGCVLKDTDGNVLASLWGITDPDNNYQRVVEAELAAEAIYNERQISRFFAD
jgi:hypothetical protein